MRHIKFFEQWKLINEDFKSQKSIYLSQLKGIPNADQTVDKYLDDFREIKVKKHTVAANAEIYGLGVNKGSDRFDIDKYKTFQELKTFVDYVSGQVKVGSANFDKIEVNATPIFENEEVEIYYGNSPKACIQIKGNLPYSWCVSRKIGNLFYHYRLKEYEPTFYFIKRKKAMEKEYEFRKTKGGEFEGEWNDKYHFFVVQVPEDVEIGNKNKEQYYVTSASNDGDRKMSWKQILEKAPELRVLQSELKPKPLNPTEKEKVEKYFEGLSDEEYARLPYIEKEFFISIYPDISKRKLLTDNQFENTPDDLKNTYIGTRVGLTDEQFNKIKGTKLLKRYKDVTKEKFEEFLKGYADLGTFVFQPSEFQFIDIKEFAKLLDSDGLEEFLEDLESGEKDFPFTTDEFIDIVIKKSGREFTPHDFDVMVQFTSKESNELAEEFINILGGEGIDNYWIGNFFKYSEDPNELAEKIIKAKGKNFDEKSVFSMLFFFKNGMEIKKLLLDAGVDAKLIETQIKKLNNQYPPASH